MENIQCSRVVPLLFCSHVKIESNVTLRCYFLTLEYIKKIYELFVLKVLEEAPADGAKPQQGDWVEVSYEMCIAGQEKVLESESNRKICVQDMDIVQGTKERAL